jgi:amino acid transporter
VLGRVTGGTWLQALVSVDAFVVLAGAVLTDYLGFIGVAERMAMDQCLPRFFLAKNQWRNTKHWLIIGFLLLCTSMYLLLEGKIAVLANVYAVSFFGVMGLYAVGDMLLKVLCCSSCLDLLTTAASNFE